MSVDVEGKYISTKALIFGGGVYQDVFIQLSKISFSFHRDGCIVLVMDSGNELQMEPNFTMLYLDCLNA